MAAAAGELSAALLPGGAEGGAAGAGAVPRLGSGRRLAWTATLCWAILGIGVALAALGPTLKELTAQLEIDTATASTLFTFRAFGYLIGSVWCGDLLHRFSNVAAVFAVPLTLAATGAVMVPQVTSYAVMVVLFWFQGLSMGMWDTGGNLVILDLWRGSSYQNAAEHFFHFLFGLGAALAPATVGALLRAGFAATAAWPIAGGTLLLTCAGLLALAGGPQPRLVEQDGDASAAPAKPGAARAVALTGAFLFVYVGLEVAFGGYIDLFSLRWLGATLVQGASLTTVYWSALCVGRAVAAAVTPFVHHVRYLAVHLVLAIGSSAWLLIECSSPDEVVPGSSAYSFGVVLPTAVFGFALAPLFPGAMLVAEELLEGPIPPRDAGRIVGVAAAGEMVLPLLVGALFAEVSPLCFCWMMCAMCTGAAAIFTTSSGKLLARRTAP